MRYQYEDGIQKKDKEMFYHVFFIWYFMENITVTNFKSVFGNIISIVDNYNSYIVLALLIFYIVRFNVYNKNEIVIIAIISFLIITITINSHNNHMISLWLFIIASKGVDFRRIVLSSYRIISFVMLITMSAALMGVIPDYITLRGNLVRHSLGYGHVNVLGMKVFQWCIYYTLLNYRDLTKKVLVYSVIFLSALFAYYVPNSKTPVILLAGLLVLMMIYYAIYSNQTYMSTYSGIMILGAVVFNVMSVFCCIRNFRGNLIFSQINKFLSSRFSLSHIAYKDLGTSLFGKQVFISAIERRNAGLSGMYFLDITYVILLVRYGIVFFAIFSISYIATMVRAKKHKDYMMVIIYFIYALYGVMEPSMYRFSYNITLLYLGSLIFGGILLFSDESKHRIIFKISGSRRKMLVWR